MAGNPTPNTVTWVLGPPVAGLRLSAGAAVGWAVGIAVGIGFRVWVGASRKVAVGKFGAGGAGGGLTQAERIVPARQTDTIEHNHLRIIEFLPFAIRTNK